MIGKDLYKIDANNELSNERLKSLIFFYGPLIGHDALSLYQYLLLKGSTMVFNELNDLLGSLNISIDSFEKICTTLNMYKLLKTLKQDNKYIFIFNLPLTRKEFINNDILVREFILKTSGAHYQELIADIYNDNEYHEFKDVSATITPDISKWSENEETYLKPKDDNQYEFNTLFNIKDFLSGMSTILLPMRFRSKENMYQIATLADLYNISYEKMRQFVPKVFNLNTNEFDVNKLRYLCMHAYSDYHPVNSDQYDCPCSQYLMSIQGGVEPSEFDKKIIYKLSSEYNLNHIVINVLLKYALDSCQNKLIGSFIYPIAADMHRNKVTTSKDALARLNTNQTSKTVSTRKKQDKEITYTTDNNPEFNEDRFNEIMNKRNKQ